MQCSRRRWRRGLCCPPRWESQGMCFHTSNSFNLRRKPLKRRCPAARAPPFPPFVRSPCVSGAHRCFANLFCPPTGNSRLSPCAGVTRCGRPWRSCRMRLAIRRRPTQLWLTRWSRLAGPGQCLPIPALAILPWRRSLQQQGEFSRRRGGPDPPLGGPPHVSDIV